MPNHCSVRGCRANYQNGPKLRTFSFPKDNDLLKKWLSAINREDFVPSIHSKVCQKHFKPEDIQTETSAFDPKKQVTITVQLKNHRLKPDAVPSIFEDPPTKRCKKVNISLKDNQEQDKIESSVGTNLIMEEDKTPEKIDDDDDEEDLIVDLQSPDRSPASLQSPSKHMPNVSVCLKDEDRVPIQRELKGVKRSPSTGSNSSTGSSEAQKLNPSIVKRRKIEKPAPVVIGRQNDCYCWVCHRENIILCCIACPRAYHPKCAGEMSLPTSDWVCPECQKILAAENVDTRSSTLAEISLDKLGALLKLSLNKMKQRAPIAFHQPVSLEHYPLYPHYVIHPMDFSLLEKNIKQKVYGCTEAFLADVKWISHNSCVFNGTQHPLSTNAKNLVKACDQDMQEIEVCPDCFVHSVVRNKYWFSEVCRKPHPLVWAKLKGFPYWPAKVVRILDGNVDARFFGAHDRAWVPVSQCYHLSKEMPTTSKPKKKGNYEVALDELNVHVHLLIQKFGCFEYAPYRTSFNPQDKVHMYHGIDIDKVAKEEISFDISSPVPEKFHSSEKENRFASFFESEREKLNSEEIKFTDTHSEKHSKSPLKINDVIKSPFLFTERKSTDSVPSEKETVENEESNEKNTLEDKTNDQKRTEEVKKSDVFQVSPVKISEKVSASDQFRKLELALERIKGYVSLTAEPEKENDKSEKDDKDKSKNEEDKNDSEKAKEFETHKTTLSSTLLTKTITLPAIETDNIEETSVDVTKSLETSRKTDSFFLKLNETIASCRAKLGISEVMDDSSDESGTDENASRSDDEEENTSSSEPEEESSDEEAENEDDEESEVMEISDEEVENGNEENELENKTEETDEENSKSDQESDSESSGTDIESHANDASPKKSDKTSALNNKDFDINEKETTCVDENADLSKKENSDVDKCDGEIAIANSETGVSNPDIQMPEITVDDSGALEVVGGNSSSESSNDVKVSSSNEPLNPTVTSLERDSIAAVQPNRILVNEVYSENERLDITEDNINKNMSSITKMCHTSENNESSRNADKNSYPIKTGSDCMLPANNIVKKHEPSDVQIPIGNGDIPENSSAVPSKNESVEEDDDIFICTPTRPKSPPIIILDDDAENENSSVSDTYAVKSPPYSTSAESFSNEENPVQRQNSGDEQDHFSSSEVVNIKRRASSEKPMENKIETNGISDSVDSKQRRKRKLSSEESSDDEIQIVTPVKKVGLTGAKRTFNKPNAVETTKRVSPTLESVKRNLVKEGLEKASKSTPPSKISEVQTDSLRSEPNLTPQTPQNILRTPVIDTRNLSVHEKEILFLKRKLNCLMTAYKIQGWKCNQEREELRHNMNLIIMEMRACLEADKKQAIDILVRKLEKEKQKSVEEAKRKQWCATCLSESRYACCWNTSYCSIECQKRDFLEHRKSCSQLKKKQKQNILRKIIPAPCAPPDSNEPKKVILLNIKPDAKKAAADRSVSVTSQQTPVSKPEIQLLPPNSTLQIPTSASSPNPVQVVLAPVKPSPELNVTTPTSSTMNLSDKNLDSAQIITHVRNKACDLGTAISLLKKKNLESTLSILSQKKEQKDKEETSKDEADLEDVYFPSPPKITFEGYDSVSPEPILTINEMEDAKSNCDAETPTLQEEIIPVRDIDLSDTDEMDNSMVNIGHSVEVKAKFLNKCLVYGQTATKLARCLVDIIFPDIRLLASCSAFGQKSNVTKLTRAALPARKVYAIIDFVTKRFPYALRSEIVLAINMKCKEARLMLSKSDYDSQKKSRRLLAKEQEEEMASSVSTAEAVNTSPPTINTSSPAIISPIIIPKTHPNVVCVKSLSQPQTKPFNMTKTTTVSNFLRCSPQLLMPKPMLSNAAILQTPPLPRKRETVKELLSKNMSQRKAVKDGPNLVMAIDAHKQSGTVPVSVSSSSTNVRPFIIIGTNTAKQPSPVQNPVLPDSSKK